MLFYLATIKDSKDRKRFISIYKNYRGLMFQVAYQILGSESDAEDAVHDAFTRIVPLIGRIEDAESPKTKAFAASIAENRAIDMLRKRNLMAEEELDEAAEPSAQAGPENAAESNTIAGVIASLPAGYREVLLWRYDLGLTVREIAEAGEKTEAAVEKMIQRAKARLKIELAKEDIYVD